MAMNYGMGFAAAQAARAAAQAELDASLLRLRAATLADGIDTGRMQDVTEAANRAALSLVGAVISEAGAEYMHLLAKAEGRV